MQFLMEVIICTLYLAAGVVVPPLKGVQTAEGPNEGVNWPLSVLKRQAKLPSPISLLVLTLTQTTILPSSHPASKPSGPSAPPRPAWIHTPPQHPLRPQQFLRRRTRWAHRSAGRTRSAAVRSQRCRRATEPSAGWWT